jgi:hypothetical protein
MSEYKVEWTNEEWFKVTIEAENEEEAMEKFWRGDYDSSLQELTGNAMQESLSVELLDDEFEDD